LTDFAKRTRLSYRFTFLIFYVCFVWLEAAAQETWKIDAGHSSIQFSVDHLVVSEVTGKFEQFEGTIIQDGNDFSSARISGQIEVSSINTGNTKRDDHLIQDDFFQASVHPSITFSSRKISEISDGNYEIIGDLTIKGITKEVHFQVIKNGTVEFYGQVKSGIKATCTIDRFDFGLNWNSLLETGGAVVGKEIRITLTLEIVREGN